MPRRSFMKKSVIAAVAASNMTIFSGLVNAIENPLFAGSGTVQPCIFKKEALLEPGGQPSGFYACYWQTDGSCIEGKGYCYNEDSVSNTTTLIEVDCLKHRLNSYVMCNMIHIPES